MNYVVHTILNLGYRGQEGQAVTTII